MPEVMDKSRIRELKSALREKVEANNSIAAAFKIEDNGGVVVSPEQRDAFRKNLDDAREIKSLIDDLEVDAELKSFLDQPEGGSAAVRAAAGGASGLVVPEMKSLGERFVSSEEFKSFQATGRATMDTPWAVEGRDLPGMGAMSVKDVYTALAPTVTNLGFGRTQRDPMIQLRQRTQRVRDLFPVATTNANLIEFYKVTGFTNNAAPVAERNAGNTTFQAKPQSSLTFGVDQAPVRTIAHFEVAHRNVLADEPQLRAIIDNELMYGLRLVEDAQILQGDGTGENLLGLLNTTGTQEHDQADVADDTKVDALRRAATKVVLALYDATGFVLHPYDWEDIELLKDAQDRYLLVTNIAIGADARVWRQPVVESPAMPQGTFVTGAWGLGAQLYDREQGNIRIAEQHADFFVRNAIAILAEERLAFAVKRPESFVIGTFTPDAP